MVSCPKLAGISPEEFPQQMKVIRRNRTTEKWIQPTASIHTTRRGGLKYNNDVHTRTKATKKQLIHVKVLYEMRYNDGDTEGVKENER